MTHVLAFTCPPCGDEWYVPNPHRVREECRDCGSQLSVETLQGVVA